MTSRAGRFPKPARAPYPAAVKTALSRSVRNWFQIGSLTIGLLQGGPRLSHAILRPRLRHPDSAGVRWVSGYDRTDGPSAPAGRLSSDHVRDLSEMRAVEPQRIAVLPTCSRMGAHATRAVSTSSSTG